MMAEDQGMSEMRFWLTWLGYWAGGLLVATLALIALMWLLNQGGPEYFDSPGGGGTDYPEPGGVNGVDVDSGW